jgi:hypothetical protein
MIRQNQIDSARRVVFCFVLFVDLIGADRAERDCVCVCVCAHAHRENDDGRGGECRSSVCLFVRSSREVVSYSAGCSFDLF